MVIDLKFNIGDEVFCLVNDKIVKLRVRKIYIDVCVAFGSPNLFLGEIRFSLHEKYIPTYTDSSDWIQRTESQCFKTKEGLINSL